MQTKQKISVSLSSETVRLEEANRERLGFFSRSELTEVAIVEYINGQTLRQFPEELARVYESIERREIKDMEDRMAKLLYKIAVEIAQVNLFFTSQMELSKSEIYDLRRDALKMVNDSHGFVDLKKRESTPLTERKRRIIDTKCVFQMKL